MNPIPPPEVGQWYRRADRPQPFMVVACDEDGGTVDLEYLDGTVDEWPLSHWRELAVTPCGTPQEEQAAFDAAGEDDLPAIDPVLLAERSETMPDELPELPLWTATAAFTTPSRRS